MPLVLLFSAFTLLVGQQERHPVRKKLQESFNGVKISCVKLTLITLQLLDWQQIVKCVKDVILYDAG